MSEHVVASCPRCERALEFLDGNPTPLCVNPRRYASPFIDDAAVVRIVIELRPNVGIVATWWKHGALSGFDGLRWFHALIGTASAHLPNVIRGGMERLARWN